MKTALKIAESFFLVRGLIFEGIKLDFLSYYDTIVGL